MRTVLWAALIGVAAGLVLKTNEDNWRIVGTPEIIGTPPVEVTGTKDMKCHGNAKCGDPFVAFYNQVTETCIDKYDAGAECGYFESKIQKKVCKFNYVCHDWKDEKHPNKRTCLRPRTEEHCKECLCGRCTTKQPSFGDEYRECDMMCEYAQSLASGAKEHCARATVVAEVTVKVHVEDSEGRQGTGEGTGKAEGQEVACVPCGPGADKLAEQKAIDEAQREAIEAAVKAAAVEAKKAAIEDGKNSMTRAEREAAAKKAQDEADAAAKAASDAQKAVEDAKKAEADAAKKAHEEAIAAGKSDDEAKAAADAARAAAQAERDAAEKAAKEAAAKAAQEAAEAEQAAAEAAMKAKSAADAKSAQKAAAKAALDAALKGQAGGVGTRKQGGKAVPDAGKSVPVKKKVDAASRDALSP